MGRPPRYGNNRPPGGPRGRRGPGRGEDPSRRGEGRFRSGSGPGAGRKFSGAGSGPDRKFRDSGFRPDKKRDDRGPGAGRKFGDRGPRSPREFGERRPGARNDFRDRHRDGQANRGPGAGGKFGHSGPGAGRKFGDRGPRSRGDFGDRGPGPRRDSGDRGPGADGKFGHSGPGAGRKFGDRGPRSPREFGERRPGARNDFRDRNQHRQRNRPSGGLPEGSGRPDDRSGRSDRFKPAKQFGRSDRFNRGGRGERFDRGERERGPRFERGPAGEKPEGGGPPRGEENRAGRQRFGRKFGKPPRAGSGPGRTAERPRFQPEQRLDPAQRPEQGEPRFERGSRVEIARAPERGSRLEIARAPEHTLPVRLLVATEEGEIYDHPALEVLPARPGEAPPGGTGENGLFRPLPWGSRVVMLPGRKPVGWDPGQRRRVEVDTIDIRGEQRRVFAAAAVLAPAWLRLRGPVFARTPEAPQLPQWAYADAGWRGEGVVAATVRIDEHTHWDPRAYNTPDLQGRVERRLAGSPANRVLRQLARCALEYSCTTAQNVFYQRHEGALPVSAACNAECLGCLSYRPPGEAPSSHERLPSTARVEDLVDVALEHLRAEPEGIVSFGQGCEGEPLLAGERLERAIIAIRSRTRGGTLHLNSNASLPAVVGKLFTAGLDSLRVSLNSAVRERYARYYKPSGYAFEDVRASLGVARGKGGFVSLNVLVHPGFSDRPSEIDALVRLVNEFQIDLVQLRNLAIDPDDYLALYPEPEEPLGMGEFLRRLRTECPTARIGNFNLPRVEWGREAVETLRGGKRV